jgi:hypothetical protein
MRDRELVPLAAVLLLLAPGWNLLLAQAEDELERPPGVEFELEAELEFALENEPSVTVGETTFDEVGWRLAGERWQLKSAVKFRQGAGLRVEEGELELRGESPVEWSLRLGRTQQPSGVLESHFVEDPMTVALGEIDADAIVVELRGEAGGLALSALRSRNSSASVDFCLQLARELGDGLELSAAWSSDLGESVELAEIRDELDEVVRAAEDQVPAVSLFLGFASGRWQAHGEALTALGEFRAGAFDEDAVRPQALDLELAHAFRRNWKLAARYERSREFPEQPTWQSGVALWYVANAHAELGVDFLHADGRADEWPRRLVSVVLALGLGDADER